MEATPTRTRERKRKPNDRRTTIQCSASLLDRINACFRGSGAVNKPMLLDAFVTAWERADADTRKAVMKEKLDAFVGNRLKAGGK